MKKQIKRKMTMEDARKIVFGEGYISETDKFWMEEVAMRQSIRKHRKSNYLTLEGFTSAIIDALDLSELPVIVAYLEQHIKHCKKK